MEDFKQLMQHQYLQYASYVILDRAIPKLDDGLKPVQRRILHTLWEMDDGKLHKVANAVGQTMMLHPHGDAPIGEALINLANKGYLLDTQGNFGNLYTGDPPAAARYIETRLSSLSKETLFNPALTKTIPSYDGRHQEPVALPAKIPLVLMQGATGIAVGMSTSILPHNFIELLEAEIALLEGEVVEIVPDFPTGGLVDATEYDQGRGKVKLRARITERDSKTIVITEICYGTTTESLIRSIDEAAKRGKIKIEGINDYTAEKVEIEIKLPRGQYANEIIPALYAFTECEVTLNSQLLVIKDEIPCEMRIDEVLDYYVANLKEYLKRELEIERDRLQEKIFEKTLEEIFIDNRLYLKIENLKSYEEIHRTVENSLKPFHSQLSRIPEHEDRERLLAIPIRRISRFDLEKNREGILALEKELKRVLRDLKNIKKCAIQYLQNLIQKYGASFPRRTEIKKIEDLDLRAIQTREEKVGFDLKTGFVGTKVSTGQVIECTNFDKLLLFFSDGTFVIKNIPEKEYMPSKVNKLIYVGIADKKSVFSIVYRDPLTHYCYAKRFIVKKFILGKNYCFFEPGMCLEYFTTEPNHVVEVKFIPKIKQKRSKVAFNLDSVLIKGVAAKGIRIASRGGKKVKFLKKELPVNVGEVELSAK